MIDNIQFDTYLLNSTTSIVRPLPPEKITTNPPIFSSKIKNVTEYGEFDKSPSPPPPPGVFEVSPIVLTAVSTVSTLILIYMLTKEMTRSDGGNDGRNFEAKSTPLPGYGILGDKVNEMIELFLDALAVYVHNDNKWECQRRMLCEANQRAGEYGVVQGLVMYFLSLGVSLLLQHEKVSNSLQAMQIGRRGGDCSQLFANCPFSL